MKRIIASVAIFIFLFCQLAAASLFVNEKIAKALQDGTLTVGMTKQSLVSVIGYPPEGKPKQSPLFYRFAKSKVTAGGKEESWTYQIGATADGIRSVTFTIIDDKVQEWSEWLDTNK